MNTPIIVINSRISSKRFPGKPLADIHGLPMIVHVWRRAIEYKIGPVLVAADSSAIYNVITDVGGTAVMINPSHPSEADRVFEAINIFDPRNDYKLVITLQDDLPNLAPSTITAALSLLDNHDVHVGTVVAPISEASERQSLSVVKMVGSDLGGGRYRCLLFTRACAPWGDGPIFHHIGLYAMRRDCLSRFVQLAPSHLEKREQLEQMRAIENGMRIDAVQIDESPVGVDTLGDLERVRLIMEARR